MSGGPYIVNGERDAIGASGEFYGAGTVFSYHRAAPHSGDQDADIDQPAVETILAPGPLTSNIDIMVCISRLLSSISRFQQQRAAGAILHDFLPFLSLNTHVRNLKVNISQFGDVSDVSE